jgi:preprotein translocase subunit SecE
MAKGQNIVQGGGGRKPPTLASRPASSPIPSAPAKKRVGPVQFLREVRAEARKVTWTSWKETWITSIMVGIMVVATAVFFFGVDWILGLGISAVLKLANAE